MNIKNLVDPFYIYERRDRILPRLRDYAARWTRGIQKNLAIHGFLVTSNDKNLAELKDKHKGKRCFVIGNGPSLMISDLDKLKDEISIASNKIYLAFDKTKWRPTYYTVADRLVAENNTRQINLLNHVKLFPKYLKPVFEKSDSYGCNLGSYIYFTHLEFNSGDGGKYVPLFSSNALLGFHVGETITNLNIQLANYLGCNPIYLIGIDGKYNIPDNTSFHPIYKKVLVSKDELNHFCSEYRQPGETWSIPKPEYHELAYECCKRFLENRNVTILNASRRSYVKTFSRVSFDSIFLEED